MHTNNLNTTICMRIALSKPHAYSVLLAMQKYNNFLKYQKKMRI